jgi:uncharacterized protein
MWQEAIDEIAKSSRESSIYIGCDSQLGANNRVHYSTVIVLHKDSRNGCRVFHNSVTMPHYGSMRARLLQEVQLALEAFYAIEEVIEERALEIHLDFNSDSKYASNVVTAEALGWVRGLGLTARIKPDAFAATHAADHFVRARSSAG